MALGAPGILGAALFALYARTAFPTVGPGDSGELTAALTTWGIPHAPGFPLLALIGNVVSHLVHVGEPAFVLNLLNAAFAALTCAVLSAAVAATTASTGAGIVAGLALGVSRIYWLHALALEVFSLNSLMAALLLLLTVRFERSTARGRTDWNVLPAAALVMSATVTHHTTLALVALPALIVVAVIAWHAARAAGTWRPMLRAAGQSLLAAIVGLLPLLYLPLAARRNPELNWGDPRNLEGVLHILMRKDFGTGTLMAPEITVTQVLLHGESASPLGFRHFIGFWLDLPHSLGWPFLALAILGAVWLARRSRALLALVVLFFVLLVVFFARVNPPVLPIYRIITERFFILPHMVIAFLAGCGVAQLAAWARPPGMKAAVVVVAGLVTAAPMLPVRLRTLDHRRDTFDGDLGFNQLAGMPEGAVFFSAGDLFTNTAVYERLSLGRRPDVVFVNQDRLISPAYVEGLRRRGVDALPPDMIAAGEDSPTTSVTWLDYCVARYRDVVAKRFIDESYGEAYRLVPLGLWGRVIRRDALVDPVRWEREFSGIVGAWNPRSLARPYDEGSWEAVEEDAYKQAIGQLDGLRDAIEITTGARPSVTIPALERADLWTGASRAQRLAYRADLLRAWIQDSLVRRDPAHDARIAARAMEQARAALDLDAQNLKALQTASELMASRPELADPRAELALRRRIADLRPGYVLDLIPYFRLALRIGHDPAHPDPAVLRDAETVHQRLVRLFAISHEIYAHPRLAMFHDYWNRPLETIAEVQ